MAPPMTWSAAPRGRRTDAVGARWPTSRICADTAGSLLAHGLGQNSCGERTAQSLGDSQGHDGQLARGPGVEHQRGARVLLRVLARPAADHHRVDRRVDRGWRSRVFLCRKPANVAVRQAERGAHPRGDARLANHRWNLGGGGQRGDAAGWREYGVRGAGERASAGVGRPEFADARLAIVPAGASHFIRVHPRDRLPAARVAHAHHRARGAARLRAEAFRGAGRRARS